MANSTTARKAGADRRNIHAKRTVIKLAAKLPDVADANRDALILNISSTGVLFQTSRDMAVGEAIEIDLGEAGRQPAEVKWTIDGMAGCQFSRPLAKAALSAALLRSDVVSPPPPAAADGPRRAVQSPGDKRVLGDAITAARKQRGMRQGDLARAIGVSVTTVCKWEQGHVSPRAKALAKLESCLGGLAGPAPSDAPSSRTAPASAAPSPAAAPPTGDSGPEDGIAAEDVIGNVLMDCKSTIARTLGLEPEAINLKLALDMSV
jgi:transcriptional regulator with XRE-family HTH domain